MYMYVTNVYGKVYGTKVIYCKNMQNMRKKCIQLFKRPYFEYLSLTIIHMIHIIDLSWTIIRYRSYSVYKWLSYMTHLPQGVGYTFLCLHHTTFSFFSNSFRLTNNVFPHFTERSFRSFLHHLRTCRKQFLALPQKICIVKKYIDFLL